MQNAADFGRGGGGYFINVNNAHECLLELYFVLIWSQSVRYWYEIREVLVPNFHKL